VSDPDAHTHPPRPGAADGGDEPKRGQEPWLRFAIVFGALAIASELLFYGVILDSTLFHAYLDVLATIGGEILNFFGAGVKVSGPRIMSKDFAVAVAEGCDAIQVCSLLASAVIAFPLSWPARARGLLAGIGILQVLNLARIVTLYWVGVHWREHFHTAHELVWPGVLIVATIAIWILWVRFELPLADRVADDT